MFEFVISMVKKLKPAPFHVKTGLSIGKKRPIPETYLPYAQFTYAESLLKAALEKDPNNLEIEAELRELHKIMYQSKSFDTELDISDVDPVAEAEVYMAYGRYSQAEQILKEAIEKDPNNLAAQSQLNKFLSLPKDATELNKSKGSVSDKVIRFGGLEVDPVVEAEVYLAYGRNAQAAEILEEAININPDNLKAKAMLLEIRNGM